MDKITQKGEGGQREEGKGGKRSGSKEAKRRKREHKGKEEE